MYILKGEHEVAVDIYDKQVGYSEHINVILLY
jgi:hypothetical protein